MEFDPVLMARIQFAFVMAFHIIFPSFTIGLASWLVVLEARWLLTKEPKYKSLYQFWTNIFAVAFGMGVVSGIVMSFQFGTNWDAASAPESQRFMIWGFVILVPVILAYTTYSYWVFRGKVTHDSGYH